MRHLIASLVIVLFTVSGLFMQTHAQDMEQLMKQLEEQGMTEEDLQKMMESMGAMMPQMIASGTYSHPEQGYSVEIPDGWTGSMMDRALIAFEGQMMQEAFGPDAKAFIIFEQTEEEITEAFRGKKIDEIDIDEFQAEVKKAMREQAGSDDIEIKKIERTTINGHDTFHVLQRFRANDPNVQIDGWMMAEMYVFQKGTNHLNIVYMTPEEEWTDYQEFTSKHISTFKF